MIHGPLGTSVRGAAKVVLAHASRIEGMLVNGELAAGGSWVYFGEDYQLAGRLKESLAARGWRELSCRRELQELAERHREGYCDLIGELGRGADRERWLGGSIAERNPLHWLYLDVCRALLAHQERPRWLAAGPLLIVCARAALLETVSGLYPGAVCRPGNPWRRRVQFLWDSVQTRWRFLRRWTAAKIRLRGGAHRPPAPIVIRTWVDRRNLAPDGSCRDDYFGVLPESLAAARKEFCFLPYFLDSEVIAGYVAACRRSGQSVILYEQLLSWRALAGIAITSLVTLPWRVPKVRYSGVDVTPLLDAAASEDYRMNRIGHWLVEIAAIKALARVPARPARIIYLMENQPWEKALCAAVARFLPGCVTVGYQHNTVCRQYLMYCPAAVEKQYVPQPDLIATAGEFARDYLRRYGYRSRIVVAGALRFTAPAGMLPSQIVPAKWRRYLVALPYDRAVAIELALKTVAWARRERGCRFTVKPHPCVPLPRAVLAQLLGEPNLAMTAAPMPVALAAADAVVYANTSVGLEALVAGIPAISYRPEYSLTQEPLDAFPDLVHHVEELEQIPKLTVVYPPEVPARLRRLVAPVRNEGWQIFLKGND